MTRSTPTSRVRLVTGLLATAGIATAVTAAALPSSAGTLVDNGIAEVGGLVPTVTSSNIRKIGGIPETAAISMEFARTGPYAYVSSLDTISVLDLTDPRNPRQRGTLTQALFENEAMTYGERTSGGVLTRYGLRAQLGEAGMIAALSLVVHPAIAFGLAQHVFALPAEFVRSAVVTAAMAPGVNAYVFANLYARGQAEAASVVLLATGASVLTVSAWLSLLARFG